MTLIYVSNGTWFAKDTMAVLIDDYRPLSNCGLFSGTRVCQNPKSENKKLNEVYWDEEVCDFDEFDIMEEE